MTPAVLDYIINSPWPPILSSERPRTFLLQQDQHRVQRYHTLQADWLLTSNVYALLKAFGVNKTHAYLFDEGLGLHGEDTPYTFYNYIPNGTVAKTFQDWILSFAATGNPNGKGEVNLPVYGENRTMGYAKTTYTCSPGSAAHPGENTCWPL